MENSLIPSMNEALSASKTKTTDDDSPEESSWTFYMQDFMSGSNDNSSFSSGYGTSSLVSDAASSAARKLATNNNETALYASEGSNCNKSSFKRPRKAEGAGVNDDLEDTASSPVNTPKVSYLNQLILKQNERNNKNVSDLNNQGQTNSSLDGSGITEGDRDYSELKKKGLCIVPVSMLTNYFG